jgi:hypothetical protein
VPGFLENHIWSFRNKCPGHQRGCPDPFSVCQYAQEDGSCAFGYAACLQKMGCNGKSGETDCIGTALGLSSPKIPVSRVVKLILAL